MTAQPAEPENPQHPGIFRRAPALPSNGRQMPVRRIPGHPNTRVYTRAGVVVHNGHVDTTPVDLTFTQGGEGEVTEFAMASLQHIDCSQVTMAVMGRCLFMYSPTSMLYFDIYSGHDMIL